MKITNGARFAVIATGSTILYGSGWDTRINPGETVELFGPTYIDMFDEKKHVEVLAGEIVCQGLPSEEHGYFVAQKKPLIIGGAFRHVTVRHHDDPPVVDIVVWQIPLVSFGDR